MGRGLSGRGGEWGSASAAAGEQAADPGEKATPRGVGKELELARDVGDRAEADDRPRRESGVDRAATPGAAVRLDALADEAVEATVEALHRGVDLRVVRFAQAREQDAVEPLVAVVARLVLEQP